MHLDGNMKKRKQILISNGLAYVMPVLFTTILVSLDNIQEHLENPFDQIGEDDIVINAEKFVERPELK